jgi:hypothetical protein
MKFRLIQTVVVVTLGVLLTAGTGVWSYLRTSQRIVKKEIQDAVPASFQLERLQQMVDDLVPEIQKNRVVVAENEVDVQKLRQEIDEQKAKLSQAQSHIVKPQPSGYKSKRVN